MVALLALLVGWAAPADAFGASGTRVLRYHGYRLVVPASWPVFRLATDPRACVRFDRHAVYLGRPSADQRCPAYAVGRTEAILVEPLLSRLSRAGAGGGQVLPAPSTAGAAPVQGSSQRLVNSTRGVLVTATWSRHPAVIERALGVSQLGAAAVATRASGSRRAVQAAVRQARSGGKARVASSYTGLGFDACSTPSLSQMAAWGSSPYRAIGVYIGGTNMACSQGNLTSSWVSRQSAAGWHLVPIYVGLQAPSNSCGCASISSGSARSQGAAAARDAVVQAQAVGLGPGNPVYFDMEAYTTGSGNSSAVLAFLGSWTSQLHAAGYQSGVYSSDNYGIQDLVSQAGTGYLEPDDIWIANWNGAKSTSDQNVPSQDWPSHQRLHQYEGAHDETYRGVTINIDGDYVNGATAVAGSGVISTVAASPTVSVSPAANGAIALYPSWGGATGVSSWQVLAGASRSSLNPVANPVSSSVRTPIVIHSAFRYFAVQALGSAGQTLGSSATVATPAHVAIFGQNAFIPSHGTAGLPVECVYATPCLITTTISAGKNTLARTGPENIPVGGGLAYFNLSAAARVMLARASHHRLPVQITVRDSSGHSATRRLNLIPFTTSGASPPRSVTRSSTLRILATTDFVSTGGVGGILAACLTSTPCRASTTVTAAGQIIALTRPEVLGVNELGYLPFSLTPTGQALLTHAPGDQLPAKVTITNAGRTATAQIALASYR